MTPTIKALRAIGSEFAWRIYKPIVITVGILSVIFLSGSIFLTTLSAWWWILLSLGIIAILISAAVLIVIGLIINTVRPAQSKAQHERVKRFVDKIQNLADVAGTPKVIILFRVVRDMVSKKEDSYTKRISSETLSMQHDLRDIISNFA